MKKNTPINFNTSYRREIKLKPVNMDYFPTQFDALKCFIGIRVHEGGGEVCT